MKQEITTKASYVVNDHKESIQYGKAKIRNRLLRASLDCPEKHGVLCKTAITGFCGSDYEFMKMGLNGKMTEKFPPEAKRLINGHEGVVFVPEWRKYAIPVIRGGNAVDVTRYSDEENYFEYGCDKADGIMSECCFINPDMLIPLPEYLVNKEEKLPLDLAKQLLFCDPLACILFQKERIRDIAMGHNFRIYTLNGDEREDAFKKAQEDIFKRIVIFGLGTTGLLAGMECGKTEGNKVVIVSRSPETAPKVKFIKKCRNTEYIRNMYRPEELSNKIIDSLGGRATVFFGSSGTKIESEVAFKHNVLANNGIYASFSVGPIIEIETMKFGFSNQIIFGAINFRRDHMEKALEILPRTNIDSLVRLYPFEEFFDGPMRFYKKIFEEEKDMIKAAIIWDEDMIRR